MSPFSTKILHLTYASLVVCLPAHAGLTVSEVAGQPSGPKVLIQSDGQDGSGNTRFRYFPNRVGAPDKTDVIESAPALSYYYQRDRDIGQTFTVGSQGFALDAVTVRVGASPDANQGAAGGAKVSLQILEVTGSSTVFNNGSPPKPQTQWQTYDPNYVVTDDYLAGEVYTSLRVVSGGLLPLNVGTNMFLKWDLTGADEIMLDAGKRYAIVFMFDEPAENRGLAFANNFNGSYSGGHGIRRCGSSLDRTSVFIRNLNDAADVEASRQSAMHSPIMAVRSANPPGTLGYPDVDTYRDFRFYIEGNIVLPPQPPAPPLTTANGSGADTFIDSVAAGTSQGAATAARIRSSGTIRKSYFRFDLSNVSPSGTMIDGAELKFTVATSDNTLLNPFTVNVYGLNNGDSGEGWNESLTWNDGAPAHAGGAEVTAAATLLGNFSITGGSVTAGQTITLNGSQLPGLLPFLQADNDERVTFILNYETSTSKSVDFSSKENTTYRGAALTLAPVVNAGSSLETVLPATANLTGSVDSTATLDTVTTVVWSKLSGPGNVTFDTPFALKSTAAFSEPGVHVLALTATRGSFVRSSQITVAVADSFAAWAGRAFPPETAAADKLKGADPDHDGTHNLLEYALLSDPQAFILAHVPALGMEGDFVTLTYRRNLQAAGLSYNVLESETLSSWFPALPVHEMVSEAGNVRVVKAKVAKDSKLEKFLRLEVTGD